MLIQVRAVGFVRATRQQAEDDYWGGSDYWTTK